MAELLEVRDGQGSGAARAHVDACEACRAELDRVHQRAAALRALPSLRPPRDRWAAVRAMVVAARQRRWNRGMLLSGLAAAAILAVVAGRSTLGRGPAAGGGGPGAVDPVTLESLVGESRRLEEALWDLGREGRVMDALTASAIADLEDRIALVDLGIERARADRASEGQVATLWRQRVALMDALVRVHARQVSYEGF
jgi:hypothetical protein